jgi:hypothetical protein
VEQVQGAWGMRPFHLWCLFAIHAAVDDALGDRRGQDNRSRGLAEDAELAD